MHIAVITFKFRTDGAVLGLLFSLLFWVSLLLYMLYGDVEFKLWFHW